MGNVCDMDFVFFIRKIENVIRLFQKNSFQIRLASVILL
ncbi:hypothetical protein LEP1GSC008_3033 [Leptospira kirschneri serovar Bulgarica str. Nikolaevo]|uniref:Uncharacterized protein n=1 Tax=Leptospira kirschneri serovar Bulgarica str. Nikolaevo TaxID=1240687 RepID=M6EVA5_9LEPT|nr:hypothetical protein LEP1GSC008_3033 [Leptospira kirschneri serovar Bulgarica str. Nikolaevo]